MKKRLSEWLLFRLVPFLAAWLIRAVACSMKLDFLGDGPLRRYWDRGENLIFSFWHDHLFLMIKSYHGPGIRILISSSKDGEIIARVMGRFGQGAVRGSSNRGGRGAFRELVALAAQPLDLAITPDGPKGPRHQLKDGIVGLARITGRPVIPVAFACSRGHRFASWDRFLLPFPFSRGVFVFGDAVSFEKGATSETFRSRLQQAMEENERRALTHLENYGLSAV
jgi:lysophospholipid acyltransferase (LPLAT)-like uncharacterized protein